MAAERAKQVGEHSEAIDEEDAVAEVLDERDEAETPGEVEEHGETRVGEERGVSKAGLFEARADQIVGSAGYLPCPVVVQVARGGCASSTHGSAAVIEVVEKVREVVEEAGEEKPGAVEVLEEAEELLSLKQVGASL